jgi:WD40 repeat protein
LAAKPADAWQPNGAVSPDGKLLLVQGGVKEARTDVIDLDTGKKLGTIPIDSNGRRFAFGNGKPLVAWLTSDDQIGVFDARQKDPIVYLKEKDCSGLRWYPLAFSNDGQYLAEWDSSRQKLVIWDLAKRKILRETDSWHSNVRALAFSPDDKWLAMGGIKNKNDEVLLLDAATLEVTRRLAGHVLKITALAWSPDGRLLASGSEDTTVLVWEIEKKQ